MLLVASYVFYGYWDWRYLFLLLLSTTVDYFCGLNLEKFEDPRQRKNIVTISILTNLTLLGVFKYYDFFALNFQALVGNFGLTVQPYILDVILPIGISFYTFQTMSYTIDIYRKKLKPAQNFLDFALYVSFFPQLIAGPIERGTRLIPQILNPRTVSWEKFNRGLYLFFWGIFLKIFIADNLAAFVDPVFDSSGPYSGVSVLLATYAFSFQIYCDFAGYSFMAIGLGYAMGVELMENFRRPYFSKNISEFWRRWHISLSSWFRDYMFTPFYIYLGKRAILRKLPLKKRHLIAFTITLLATEYLLGLWHGAGWNFGMFGIYHAAMIGLYYYTRHYWDQMSSWLQIFLCYQLVCIGWLIFRASSLDQAMEMFKSIFTNFIITSDLNIQTTIAKMLGFIGILIIIQFFQDRNNDTFIVLKMPLFPRFAFFALLGVLILVFGNFGARPFIYFQF